MCLNKSSSLFEKEGQEGDFGEGQGVSIVVKELVKVCNN